MRALLVALLKTYKKVVSPALPHACRFQPTCSEYAMFAIETHGAAKGSWMAAKRILKCHPFGGSGFDPVKTRLKYEDRGTK